MKKVSLLVIMVLCSILGFAQNGHIDLRSESKAEIIQSNKGGFRAMFSFGSVESFQVNTDRGMFSQIGIQNTYPSGNIGSPELPAAHQLIAVPFGATPRVSVVNYTSTDYRLSDYDINTLMPRQPSVRKDQKPEDIQFVYDEAAYQAKGFSEKPLATIEVTGTLRGVRIGSLEINPVSYNPATNTLRVYNNIEVEVSYEGADYEETERMLVNTYSPYFDVVYKQLFNYREIQDVYSEHPDLWASPVHMIVITPSSYQTALQPWKEWKIQKGFDVDLYTTDQTGTTYSAIKSYIQNLYNTGVQSGQTPTFLIVIGDTGQVPASAPSGSQTQKVTDLYYSSVDNDYFPDMFYSRMSAENTNQLTAIINKILMYEKYTMPDPSYLGKALLIAGADASWNPKVGQPTINYATTNYFNTAHGFTNVYAYLNSYTGCYDNLNTGVGFANYTAHGDNQMWYQPQFTNSNAYALTNTNKYFWAIGNCCLSGNFGYGECLGEAMIRAENKAAFSYIGSCPYSYWYEDYYFSVGATNTFYSAPAMANTSTGTYDGMFMDDTYNTVSSALFLGNLAVTYASLNSYQYSVGPLYYWQAYHVLGDGSIMPYTVVPTANNVSHASSFPAGASAFTVSAAPGSYVGISKDNVLLGAGLVGTNGTATINVSPVSSGNVMIVVTRQQRQPYITTIPVGSGSSTPIIMFESCTPTEIENGVDESLNVTMKNAGTAATTGNTAVTITTSDSYLTIVNGSANFGAMAANGGTATVNNAFTVRAAANTPLNHVFTINVGATYNGNSWSSSFTLNSVAPCNAPTNLTATANGRNINLSWTASATATSYNVYRNNSQIASNVSGTSYTDSNLSYSTQYCYTVKSNCTGNQLSDPSNEACATTADPCNAPTGLTTSIVDYTNIALTWNAPANAQSYKIYRNNTMIASNITTTAYTDEDLSEGDFCYTVKSVCSNGESDPSNQSCQTIEFPCDAPEHIEGNYVYNGVDDYGVSVEWDAPAAKDRGLSNFIVSRSPNGNAYSVVGEINVVEGQTHYEYFDAVNAGLYFYQVRAYYVWGEETCTSIPGAALDNPSNNCVMINVTGLAESEANARIYPNPTHEKLFIEAKENITAIKVYNILGTMIQSISDCESHHTLEVNDLPNGVYFIEVVTSNSSMTRSFIKE